MGTYVAISHVVRTVRGAIWVTVTILTLFAFAAVAAPPADAAVRISANERAQLRLINLYRVAHGRPRLKMDRRLTRTADWMGRDMARNGYFSHTDSLGRDPFQRLARFRYPSNTWRGENLAAGYADPANTFNQWKNSPGHRANMLNRNFRAIGISRVCLEGSEYSCYWVTEFGSRVVQRIR